MARRLHPEHLDILQWKLEWCGLKANIARRVRQHEPKVDVDEVALAIQQDVAIMAVLDLEEVGDHGVAFGGCEA